MDSPKWWIQLILKASSRSPLHVMIFTAWWNLQTYRQQTQTTSNKNGFAKFRCILTINCNMSDLKTSLSKSLKHLWSELFTFHINCSINNPHLFLCAVMMWSLRRVLRSFCPSFLVWVTGWFSQLRDSAGLTRDWPPSTQRCVPGNATSTQEVRAYS